MQAGEALWVRLGLLWTAQMTASLLPSPLVHHLSLSALGANLESCTLVQ
jgi:hypothetical protein